jgi:hypothetical protein
MCWVEQSGNHYRSRSASNEAERLPAVGLPFNVHSRGIVAAGLAGARLSQVGGGQDPKIVAGNRSTPEHENPTRREGQGNSTPG